MIPNPKFYSVSDNAHVLAGALTILGPIALDWKHPIVCAGLVLFWASIKEFIYDNLEEGVDERGSNFRDWVGYLTGSGVALMLCYWRGVL